MKPLQRVKTLVPGLDDLLGGGMFEAGVYFVQGSPGSGKTTLANQMCFAHILQGGAALYLTLLAESHARMMQHMLDQSFFDASMVGRRISYVSGYRDLESGGLKGIVALARAELARQKATLLVLDGLVLPPATNLGDDDRRLKEFVHELQSLAALLGCCVMLLTSGRGRSIAAEQSMVDGIFALDDHPIGSRNERLIEVTKFRGSATARGRHSFCITNDGVRIYPRLESLETPPSLAAARAEVVASGLPGLDALYLGGGARAGSTTLLLGQSGAGKTLLGLLYLAQSSGSEPGLLAGFNEAPDVLVEVARGVGIDLAPKLSSGELHLQWTGPGDHALDQLGHELLLAVDRRGVRRLVIDSIAGFADKAMFAERGYRFVGALLDELRRRSVATVLVCDADALAALGVPHIGAGLVALVEHVVEMSVGDTGRTLRVKKARGQRFDPLPRALSIADTGLSVGGRQTVQ